MKHEQFEERDGSSQMVFKVLNAKDFFLGKNGVDFKNIDFMQCDDPCFRTCAVKHGFITKSMFCSMCKQLAALTMIVHLYAYLLT